MKDYSGVSKKLAKVLFLRRFVKWGIIAEGPEYDEAADEVAGELKKIMEVCYMDGQSEN